MYGNLTPSSGALQPDHVTSACGGTSYVGVPCSYGYVAKISGDKTKLLYATYLTGDWGSAPTSLFVDNEDNAVVSGTTSSHNFPTTSGAFQTENRAVDGPSLQYGFIGPHLPIIPPPTTGFISKINPDGTALVWSTYFGGFGIETISDANPDTAGNIVFLGYTGSPDLPGATPLPRGCGPSYLRQRPYIATVAPDGSSVIGARYIESLSISLMQFALVADGSPVFAVDNSVVTVPLSDSNPPACIVDSADIVLPDRVAPGQLLTVFSSFENTKPPVTFNGVPGDILYSGPDQINVRVPEALTGSTVNISVAALAGEVSWQFGAVAVAPSAFLRDAPACVGSSYPLEIVAVALNEDGSLNSCDRPAAPGSLVTFFLNGTGNSTPAVTSTAFVVSASSDPGSPGVIRVQVRLGIPSPYSSAYATFSLSVDGRPVRDSLPVHIALLNP